MFAYYAKYHDVVILNNVKDLSMGLSRRCLRDSSSLMVVRMTPSEELKYLPSHDMRRLSKLLYYSQR